MRAVVEGHEVLAGNRKLMANRWESLYPFFGLTLRPEIGAIAISGSSIIVAVNALLLKRLELEE
ncbi:MAG: hypothetical protein ACE5HA_19060 [Anaerolineae bacterium]